MYFGTKIEANNAFALLNKYIENGGNFIDTSNNYAFWWEDATGDESEIMLGKWLKEHVVRDEIVLATKVGARPKFKGAGIEQLEGLSYQTIINAVEGSLKRLGTDYIDLYYSHVDWYEYPLEERLKAFDLLIGQGKVREIGASNLYPWRLERSNQICETNKWKPYCCAQLRYSYLTPDHNADFWVQKLISDEWVDYCEHNPGLTLIAYSPLLSGVYTNLVLPKEYDTPANASKLKTLSKLAVDLNITPNQLVLAWMRQNVPGIIPLVGVSKTEQLEENLDVVNIKLEEEHMDLLNNGVLQ